MRQTFLTILSLFTVLISKGQTLSERESFLKKLDSCNLMLAADNIFNSYKEVQIDTSISIKYDYAIVDTIQHCEIRYKILPLIELSKLSKDTTVKIVTVGNDMIYKGILQALYFDISQNSNSLATYQDFPSQAVKNDFNADMGGQTALESKASFGKGCKKIYAISYYKKDKAIVIVFYLLNNVDKNSLNNFGQLLLNTYKVIKFKD